MRVIEGEHAGARGPASTFTPMDPWDVKLVKNGALDAAIPGGHDAALLVLEGSVTVNAPQRIEEAGLAPLGHDGELVEIRADAESKVLLLSGVWLGEPVVQHGPFVMNTSAEIYQAIKDFQTVRMRQLT